MSAEPPKARLAPAMMCLREMTRVVAPVLHRLAGYLPSYPANRHRPCRGVAAGIDERADQLFGTLVVELAGVAGGAGRAACASPTSVLLTGAGGRDQLLSD